MPDTMRKRGGRSWNPNLFLARMPMQAVWIALGGNAMFLVVVAFLGRKLVTHWLDKDLNRFRDQLQSAASQELETLKGRLQIAANEHSILLTKLQERRAEVIGELYSKVSKGVRELASYVRPLQLSGEQNLVEKAAAARASLSGAYSLFEDKQIWLTAECAKRVDDFLEDLRKKFNHYDIARQAAAQGPDNQSLREARDASMAA